MKENQKLVNCKRLIFLGFLAIAAVTICTNMTSGNGSSSRFTLQKLDMKPSITPGNVNVTSTADWSGIVGITGDGSDAHPWTLDYLNGTMTVPILISNSLTDHVLIKNAKIDLTALNGWGDIVVNNSANITFSNVNCSCVIGYNISNSKLVNITKANIQNCTMDAFYMNNASAVIVTDSVINTTACLSYPSDIENCASIEFDRCTFKDQARAADVIYHDDCIDVYYENCKFYNNSLFFISQQYGNTTGCSFHGYSLSVSPYTFAIYITGGNNMLIKNCATFDLTATGDIAYLIATSHDIVIDGSNMTTGHTGIAVVASYNVDIERCRSVNYTNSVYIDGSWYLSINGSTFIADSNAIPNAMVFVYDLVTANSSDMVNFTNNHFDGAYKLSGLSLAMLSRGLVENNTFIAMNHPITITTSTTEDNIGIYNNTCINCVSGLYFEGTSGDLTDVAVISNTFRNVTTCMVFDGVDTVLIDSNNQYACNGGLALNYLADCNDMQVTGNYMQSVDNSIPGLFFDTCDSLEIHYNLFANCSLEVAASSNDNESRNAYYDYFVFTGLVNKGYHDLEILPDWYNGTMFNDDQPFYSVRLFGVSPPINVLLTLEFRRMNATGMLMTSRYISWYINGVLWTNNSRSVSSLTTFTLTVRDKFNALVSTRSVVVGGTSLTYVDILDMHWLTIINNADEGIEVDLSEGHVTLKVSVGAGNLYQIMFNNQVITFVTKDHQGATVGSGSLAMNKDRVMTYKNPGNSGSNPPSNPGGLPPLSVTGSFFTQYWWTIVLGVGAFLVVAFVATSSRHGSKKSYAEKRRGRK